MRNTIPLRDGGLIHFDPAFFSAAESDVFFATLRDSIAWEQEMSRGRPFPRLVAWHADAGRSYRYSGIEHVAQPWTAELLAIKQRIEAAVGATWNSVLLNRYRDGRDSMGLHADDEPELGRDPAIGSVSFGSARRFVLKHVASGTKLEYELGHGSLLVMAGTTQQFWKHGVPKTRKPVGERINLTFRRIL